MRQDRDALAEVRSQLTAVRRRVDTTLAALTVARETLAAGDLLDGTCAEECVGGRRDLLQQCVRTEVALADAREAVRRLTSRLRELHQRRCEPAVPTALEQHQRQAVEVGRNR